MTKSKIIIEHLPRFLRVRVVASLPVLVVDDHVVLVVATVHYWLCVTKSKIIIKHLLTFPPCPCGCCTLSCWTYVYGTNFGGGLENQRLGEKIDGLDLNICVGYPLQNPKKKIHGTFTHPSGWWPNRRWRCLYHSMMCWIWVTKSKIIIKHLLTFPPCPCGCCALSCWIYVYGTNFGGGLENQRLGEKTDGLDLNICVGYPLQNPKKKNHGTFTHPSGWWPNRRWRCLYHSMMSWIWVTKSKIIIKHLLTFPPCLWGCSVSSGWWLFYVGQSRKYSLKIFTFLRRGSSLTGSSFCCVGYQRQSQNDHWTFSHSSLSLCPLLNIFSVLDIRDKVKNDHGTFTYDFFLSRIRIRSYWPVIF